MRSRIVIVHPSYVVKLGITQLIKENFELDTIQLSKPDDMVDYYEMKGHFILLLIYAEFDKSEVENAVGPLKNDNEVKIVLVRNQNDTTDCDESCVCCFPISAEKERVINLLKNYLDRAQKTGKDSSSNELSGREIDVLKLVAFGKTNKEIAFELCISIHTVISHRKNITEKLGIKSISGLTVYAILNNYIDANKIDPESLI